MNDPLAAALEPVLEAFEKFGITYYIGGSVAGMTYGEYRQTNDVDVIADLKSEDIASLVLEWSDVFLVEEKTIREALHHGRSFNLIHLTEFFKVDVFPLKQRAYDHEVVARRRREFIETAPPLAAFLASPEDILLAKLEWFRAGEEISDRQWRDILGICKTQATDLDFMYLHKWAKELDIADLLMRALDQSGLTKSTPE